MDREVMEQKLEFLRCCVLWTNKDFLPFIYD